MTADEVSGRAEDYALDRLLAEELGELRPPDLEARILAAATRRTIALPELVSASGGGSGDRGRVASWIAGIAIGAATVLIGSMAIFYGAASPGPRMRVSVECGRIEWAAVRGRPVVAVSGTDLVVRPSRGDRVRLDRFVDTKLKFLRLGRLRCAPGTVLEVRDMEWKEFGGGLTAGALTVTVIFGVAHWAGATASETAETGEDLVLRPGNPESDRPPDRQVELRRKLGAAAARIAQLEEQLARQSATTRTVDSAVGEPEPRSDDYVPLLCDTSFDAALEKVRWRVVGEAVSEFIEVHRRVVALQARGEEVPRELLALEEQWEGQMIGEIGKVLRADVPGSSMTAQIHHPGIATNLMLAGLRKAGLPLDAKQTDAVQAVTRKYALEDRVRRAGEKDEDFVLANRIAENEMTARYLVELRQQLSPEQERFLSFGELARRTRSDPLSAGFQWSRMDSGIEVKGRESFAKFTGSRLSSEVGLSQAQIDVAKSLVKHWAEGLPAAWFEQAMDALDQRGSHHLAKVRKMAVAQLALLRTLGTQLDLSPEQQTKLRGIVRVFVPFKQR